MRDYTGVSSVSKKQPMARVTQWRFGRVLLTSFALFGLPLGVYTFTTLNEQLGLGVRLAAAVAAVGFDTVVFAAALYWFLSRRRTTRN
jgi:hypothetical protein